MRTKRFILASVFDPIADLHMAVEQIKREPKPQPDMVPWDEYQPRIMLARETWRMRARCAGSPKRARFRDAKLQKGLRRALSKRFLMKFDLKT